MVKILKGIVTNPLIIGVLGGFNFCLNFVFDGVGFDTSILMNHAVGYHVMGGIICLLAMMLSQLGDKEEDKAEDGKEDAA